MPLPDTYLTVSHDEPLLTIGPDERSAVTWGHLRTAAENGLPIVWGFKGTHRMISAGVVADAWRVVQAYIDLLRLGRSAEARVSHGFVWQQTIPLPPVSQSPTSG